MLCEDCKRKDVHRGIKTITCVICDKETTLNSSFGYVCKECSDVERICIYCNKLMKKYKYAVRDVCSVSVVDAKTNKILLKIEDIPTKDLVMHERSFKIEL
jgi:hypothetical protein